VTVALVLSKKTNSWLIGNKEIKIIILRVDVIDGRQFHTLKKKFLILPASLSFDHFFQEVICVPVNIISSKHCCVALLYLQLYMLLFYNSGLSTFAIKQEAGGSFYSAPRHPNN
jgi:hypothetical protein